MLGQSKRITQIGCISFLRFWLAHIVYILVLVSVANARTAVIQKREIPSTYLQKEVSDTLILNKEINRNIESNESKLISSNITEFPLNGTYQNNNATLSVLSSDVTNKDLFYNNKSNIETTTRETREEDVSVTELNYNDINAKYESGITNRQIEHNLRHLIHGKEDETKPSKEVLKIFDNDVLQILGVVSEKDVTTKIPFFTESPEKLPNENIHYKKPPSSVGNIGTINNINSSNSSIDMTIANQSEQSITEISINIKENTPQNIQNEADVQQKIYNSVQDNIDKEVLLNSESESNETAIITEVTTIQNEITLDISHNLGILPILTTVSTVEISTNNMDNVTSSSSLLDSMMNEKSKDHQYLHHYDRSLNIHDNITLQLSDNMNENEIITTTPAELLTNKKIISMDIEKPKAEIIITEGRDTNMIQQDKYMLHDNQSTNILQQMNLPSASEVWTLVGMKTIPKLNNTMETTAHEQLSKINNVEQQSISSNVRNNEKSILDWSQIMSTNELIDKKGQEPTTESDILKLTTSPLSSNLTSLIKPITKITFNDVALNESSTTTPTNILDIIFNHRELPQHNNNASLLSVIPITKQINKNMDLSVSDDNNEEKQITLPFPSENYTENIMETNTEMTAMFTSTNQIDTEIEIATETEAETETETALTTLRSSAVVNATMAVKLLEENENTIRPPTITAEKIMTLSKMVKADQEEERVRNVKQQPQPQQINFETNINTAIKNIINDAVTTAIAETVTITTTRRTDPTSVDSFTLEPTVNETTPFSTLVTSDSNVSVSSSSSPSPVFIINTPTQLNNFINNQNNNIVVETIATTTIKTNINENNTATPININKSINNNNNNVRQEGADIERYTNETYLEEAPKTVLFNISSNFIETKTTTTTTTTTPSENNFISSTLESHLITEKAETITKSNAVQSDVFSTLSTLIEKQPTTATSETTTAIVNTKHTLTDNDSTAFPDVNPLLINRENNEKNENERTENRTVIVPTLKETSLDLNIIEIKDKTTTVTATTTTTTTTLTTSTEKTPVASTSIPQSSETSIETNIIDKLNNNNDNNTKAKQNVIIEKTITYTTPNSVVGMENITESNDNNNNNDDNDNIFTMTTMSGIKALNDTLAVSQMITNIGQNHSFEATMTTLTPMPTPAATTTTRLIITELPTPSNGFRTKIEDIYNVIQNTTEKSLQEATTTQIQIKQSTLSAKDQDDFVESSTMTNTPPNVNYVFNKSMALPRPTTIAAHQPDRSENVDKKHNDGIGYIDDIGNEDGDIILPTIVNGNGPPLLYQPKTSETTDETDVNVIIAITVSVIGVVALILLVAFLYLMRKRQKSSSYSQRCRPVSLDDYTIDSTSIYNSMRHKSNTVRASKRSHANLAFDDPSLRHNVLDAIELGKFVQDKFSIYEEFRDVPQVRARVDEVPAGCEDKNRYANVVPLPETRVLLQRLNDDLRTEYINANYVRGPKDSTKYYIACQAPLESTIEDFWRMIWEQKSRVIIQATDLVENGIEKCAEYLPPSMTLDNHATFGEFQVTLHHREVKDKYATSIILLKHIEENVTREISHYWYKWPEVGVPLEEAPIIAMLLEARSSLISYAIEYANEMKKDSSTITLKSSEDNLTVISNENSQTKDNESTNYINNTEEINGNISMVHIRKKTAKYQGPLTVHCSPGTGRTGTIIACDIAIRSLEMSKRTVDIPQIVYYVRHGRANAVLTKEQYEFIYKVANMYATKITNLPNDN